MVKKDAIDPQLLSGDALVKHLVNTVEVMTGNAVSAVQKMKTDIVEEINNRFQAIAPICEQFPGLCQAVDQIKSTGGQTKTKTVSEVAESLALHYRECEDPQCRRAIRARLAAVGLSEPPGTDGHDRHAVEDHAVEDQKAAAPQEAPKTPELQPWEKLNISERKYSRNKSYYDYVLENGG